MTRVRVRRGHNGAANTSVDTIWTIALHLPDICRWPEIYKCFFWLRSRNVPNLRPRTFWTKLLKSSAKPLSVLWILCLVPALVGGEVPRAEEPRDRPEMVRVNAAWFGRVLSIDIGLAHAAPYRVFTVENPARLVIDLSEDVAGSHSVASFPPQIRSFRATSLPAGWRRLVFELGAPFEVSRVELVGTGGASGLQVRLERSSPAEFALSAGVPPGAWPIAGATGPAAGLVVAVDAGHGGVDPGAVRDGIREKDIVLEFARVLRRHLEKLDAVKVVMLRDNDQFVALRDRVAGARNAGADLLISLHTNADPDPRVSGAIAFTRAERGSSRAAAARALLENAADDRAGFGTLGAEDPVLSVLSDLARRETDARSEDLARTLISALRGADARRISGRAPLQAANFTVLRAPDIPSVLLEIGFLSNPEDRADMLSSEWRDATAADVAQGILTWAARESARSRR